MGKRGRRRGRDHQPTERPPEQTVEHRDDVVDSSPIRPSMSTNQIKAAGVAVDVPFEAPGPKDIRYADGTTFEESFPDIFQRGGSGS